MVVRYAVHSVVVWFSVYGTQCDGMVYGVCDSMVYRTRLPCDGTVYRYCFVAVRHGRFLYKNGTVERCINVYFSVELTTQYQGHTKFAWKIEALVSFNWSDRQY